MKQALLCIFVTLCAVSFARADDATRSLQQTLKEQGFYYGRVTGDKSPETTAAIRRYQIRNGLKVTGELNEETAHLAKPSSNSVATDSRSTSKPGPAQPNRVRLDANGHASQSSPPPTFGQPEQTLQTNPSYSASFYQPPTPPIRVNRQIIAGVQYQLMGRGYYRGRVDGKYGRQLAFGLRAFQSSVGLAPTGRLDMKTLDALGAPTADLAYSRPASGGHQTWSPVKKFKNGKWKMKWKGYHRPFDAEQGGEDRQANRDSEWDPYNND